MTNRIETFLWVFQDAVDDYVALAEQNIRQISENEDIPQKLIGSFRVWYGKQDEVSYHYVTVIFIT